MKLGVFGGTFNPPHLGHLIVAENAAEALHLDKVFFIPCAMHPLKKSHTLASASARVEMLRLAITGNPRFEISEVELDRGGKSYTVDTLRVLSATYPKAQLSLLIGIDNLLELHNWKEPEEIFALSQVVAINRPGFNSSDVHKEYLRRVTFLRVPNIDIASSEIRRRARCGKSIKYLVPPSVEEYILKHGAYKGIDP
jgi:nicotinate-nucleotide adenylyltransferase